MKILDGVPNYEVFEPMFECIRLALSYLGDEYAPDYFHGIAGTAFRIGGICPCAPTCTTAQSVQDLLSTLGYGYAELPFEEGESGDVARMADAVRASIDAGIPALVWHAFTMCEWNIVAGYDEGEQVFYGRGPWWGGVGEYAKTHWGRAKEEGGLVGLLGIIIKEKKGAFDSKAAEIAALREAVRHANNRENADKVNGEQWVFLNGKAAYERWVSDFSDPTHAHGIGDSYCIDIYSSTHGAAGGFLRAIAPNHPAVSDKLLDAASSFDREAECLKKVRPLFPWNDQTVTADRNKEAHALLKEASEHYAAGITLLESVVCSI